MKKDYIIIKSILAACLCTLLVMTAIWIYREREFVRMYNAYEKVLDKVYEDNTEYYLDILMETPEYAELENIVYLDTNEELK